MRFIALYKKLLRQPRTSTHAQYIVGSLGITLMVLSGCGLPGSSTTTPTPTGVSDQREATSVTTAAAPASTAQAPQPDTAGWVRHRSGTAWDLQHPADWDVDVAGQAEGFLRMEGSDDNHRYEVTFAYPMIDPAVPSVDAWVQQERAALPASAQEDLRIVDLMVAGTHAKKVLNVRETPGGPLSHRAYLWRREGKNPALVIITQQDATQPNPAHMDLLFDRLLAGIAP